MLKNIAKSKTQQAGCNAASYAENTDQKSHSTHITSMAEREEISSSLSGCAGPATIMAMPIRPLRPNTDSLNQTAALQRRIYEFGQKNSLTMPALMVLMSLPSRYDYMAFEMGVPPPNIYHILKNLQGRKFVEPVVAEKLMFETTERGQKILIKLTEHLNAS